MKIRKNIVTLLAVLVVLGSLVAIAAVPAGAVVAVGVVAANPATASSTAGYSIPFTTTVLVGPGGTVTVTFPAAVTLPATISKTLISLSGVTFVSTDADPIISGQQIIVTIPSGQNLAIGAHTLTISQAAGVQTPAVAATVASHAYPVTVVTSQETSGTNYLGVIPSYAISAIKGGRTSPVTVTGKGWTPNLGITISGGLSGTGIALADGTFSLTAYPAATGVVNIQDGAGQTQAASAAGPWDSAVTIPSFTISPRIEVSPATGDVGSKVTINGFDFTSGGNIPANSITLGGTAWNTGVNGIPGQVNFTTMDSPSYGANNDFSVTLTVPATMPGGAKTVTVVDSALLNATGGFSVNTPTVAMSPMTGEANTMVALTGTHFQAGDSIPVDNSYAVGDAGIWFAPTLGIASWNTSSVTVDASGSWSAALRVPTNASPGGNPVVVKTALGTVAASQFAVGTRVLTLTPASGPAGSMVLVTGSNMTPRNALNPTSCIVSLTFNGVPWAGAPATIDIDSQGNINPTTLQVPPGSPTGPNIVVATDSAAIPLSAVGTFTVTQPTISISPASGYKGDVITVSGSGWLPGSLGLVMVKFNGQTYAVATPDASGAFTALVTVPANAPASANVESIDIQNNSAPAKQFVLGPAKITVSPVSGPVTTTVTVTGVGFQPQSGLQALRIAGTSVLPLTTVVTDIVGKFTATFVVPGLVQQAQAVEATVGGITASTFFTITPAAVSVQTQTANISSQLVRIWGYSGGTWYMYDPATPALNDLTVLQSTNGYWFKVSSDCTLVYGGFSKFLTASDWTLVGWP